MSTKNKRILTELLFWFVVAIVLGLLSSLLRHDNLSMADKLKSSLKGCLIVPFIFTGLNMVLQPILRKVN